MAHIRPLLASRGVGGKAMDNLGSRLRALRLERGLGQAEAAKRLGISAAYLSLIEKGRRNMQLPLLWKALELYETKVESFVAGLGQGRPEHGLQKLLDEPLLRTLNLDKQALASLAAEPLAATTITALFHLYKDTRSQLDNLLANLAKSEPSSKLEIESPGEALPSSAFRFDYSPLDEVSDFLQAKQNHFPALEELASSIRRDFRLDRRVLSSKLQEVLRERFEIRVDVADDLYPSSVVRRFDEERRLLEISPELTEQRRKFDLAHFIGLQLIGESRLFEEIVSGYVAKHAEAPKLIEIHLANYFAGALLLPYDEFYEEVNRARYDVERLASAFEISYEAVAHRICNLGNPRKRGLPMHFLRVDVAGNISKRYTASGLNIPNGNGSCPKWAVHVAFMTPSTITKQYSVMPDGSTYFCFAKVSAQPISGSLARGTIYSIGLGTRADAAKYLAYADEIPFTDPEKMSVPVGVGCRFCERADCNQRAAPSYKYAFSLDANVKKDNFFSPLLDRELSPAHRIARKKS